MAPRSRWRGTLSCVAAGVTVLALAPAASSESSAVTKYEAENATIAQGVVESNHAGHSGTGFVNYDNVAGSSVEFTAQAATAGSATLKFRFANGTTINRPLDIAVNGTVVAAGVAFNGTGAWTTWQDVTVTAQLAAGTNTIKATATTANGGPNLDYLETDIATQQPGNDFEAEDAAIAQGIVESNHAGFSGRGFVNYDNVTGSHVEWTVNGPGAVDLIFRYANGTTINRPMDIAVNGTVVSAGLAFNGTGAWTTWQTVTVKATLAAGANKIRASATTANGGPNTDKLTVQSTDNEAPTAPPNLRSTGKTAKTTSLAWDAATDNVGVAGYDVYQHGQLMKTVAGNVLATTVEGLQPDTEYDWTVFAKDVAGNVSQASNNVIVRTDPAPPDNEPPTVPGNLTSPRKTATTVDLAWTASTDNEKVTGYDIFTDGAQSGSADGTATTTTVAGLIAGKEYKFKIRARDLAGNVSGFSNEIAVTPTTGGPTGVPNPGAVTTIASGVDVVWGVAFLPDGSALFSERNTFNIYRIAEGGTKQLAGKISQAAGTGGEGGLLGLEISPTFTTDHWVYVYHTAANDNRIIRIKYENGTLVQSSYQVLFSGIARNRFHNGGRLRFGPDGKLYASVGDAQNGNNAQNNNSPNGKILRLNADGSIPSDNPFGNAVWSKGHRNPQGLDFDAQGRLWAAEFGNSSQDEVNLITRGGNYGWPSCEGTSGSCGGFIPPKKTWSTSQASPSGLTIINDHVFVATTVGQRVYRMRIDSSSNLVEQQTYFQGTYNRLRTVEVDHDGDIWLTTSTDKDGTANNDRILHVDIQYSGGGGEFALTSSAFADNAMMPAKYTCAGDGTAGQDPSPPLAWSADGSAKSYAIVFSDRVNNGNKRHWIIWDIPTSALSLPENLGAGFNVPNQGGAKQKAMGSGANAQKYFGPCPGGSTNPYTFTLYAVNVATLPGVTSASGLDVIQNAIVANSGANTVLRGRSNAST
ncbi:PQQ-dependent sugar dehydrogenase [Kibdelosporangium philippinense]|uniref:PQQ-dependent sugar dehydrogenase n=1 Tax=Kibdelosporangium philippinense TaxID=211113 RepID=A0ABS8Z747_9PSEU|nr:PQQ-dependent sugar dehydrogenase [Kibdelosporangium philippinense]MCE7003317.1 PQQ-dependent sugar dehydrogenase [Kibdelosporangium philippinense]